jgi:hypothetical protein
MAYWLIWAPFDLPPDLVPFPGMRSLVGEGSPHDPVVEHGPKPLIGGELNLGDEVGSGVILELAEGRGVFQLKEPEGAKAKVSCSGSGVVAAG